MAFDFEIDVTELQEYALVLERAAGGISVAARGAVRRASEQVVQEAIRLVPIRTGDLRDSIGVSGERFMQQTSLVTVTAGMPYAGFVEFGTVKMAPQPYLRPAIKKVRPRFQRDVIEIGGRMLGTKTQAREVLRGRAQRLTKKQAVAAARARN